MKLRVYHPGISNHSRASVYGIRVAYMHIIFTASESTDGERESLLVYRLL